MNLKSVTILVSAILISSMALFFFSKRDEANDAARWGAVVDPAVCRQALERLPANMRDLRGRDCIKFRDHGLLLTTIEMVVENQTVPIRVVINDDPNPIGKVIVEIVGGPGEVLLLRPGIESLAAGGEEIIERCNAAILSPAYAGTWHRSSYPEPSEQRAAIEVNELLKSLDEKFEISVVAESLGGRIFSRPEVKVPRGNHLLFVPLLRSPQEYFGWLEDGTRKNHSLDQATFTNYSIGPEGRREPKSVRNVDFARAFFERGEGDMLATLPDLWIRKNEVDDKANIEVVIAKSEEKAGGLESAANLQNLGWSVRTIEGRHFPEGEAQFEERARLVGKFIASACRDYSSRDMTPN
ncbi:hypothetical protein LCM19_13265 [Qipengyuania flava]|nr:hypothetical protein [Qipengyuania flava]